MGIEAGISGGAGVIDVYLYKNGHAVCANSKAFGSRANIWIQLTYLTDEVQDVPSNTPATVTPTEEPSSTPTVEPTPTPTE
ncbi:MAG: hypothetical protein JWR83_1251, partial [Aeromicrobium sp.]|nr:hypothetical protein [Aeromicrobium sp.]